jgi:Phage integrase central domain
MRAKTSAAITLRKAQWLLEMIFPRTGKRPIREVTAPELLLSLRRIESRGHHETAHRAKQKCGQVFRYAIATGRAERDISADLRAGVSTGCDRVATGACGTKQGSGCIQQGSTVGGEAKDDAAVVGLPRQTSFCLDKTNCERTHVAPEMQGAHECACMCRGWFERSIAQGVCRGNASRISDVQGLCVSAKDRVRCRCGCCMSLFASSIPTVRCSRRRWGTVQANR